MKTKILSILALLLMTVTHAQGDRNFVLRQLAVSW